MDVKLATLIKSLNIMDVIFSGFTVSPLTTIYTYSKMVQKCTLEVHVSCGVIRDD